MKRTLIFEVNLVKTNVATQLKSKDKEPIRKSAPFLLIQLFSPTDDTNQPEFSQTGIGGR